MMKFEDHPAHNRYIQVTFDDNRGRSLPLKMGIEIGYLNGDDPWNTMRKAVRLDSEVMHLVKAAPDLRKVAALAIQACELWRKGLTSPEVMEQLERDARAAYAAASKTTYND